MNLNPSHQRLLLTLIAFILLAGCSSQPLAPPPSSHSDDAKAELWNWQVQGRLAVKDGTDQQSANLDWQQQGYTYQILIFGPLGQGAARLDGRPFYVTLTTGDGQHLEASSPEQLMAQGLGWSLPLSNLIYWVRGLPAPGPYQQSDSHSLRQGQWEVEWRRFTQVDDYRLPSLLIARQGEFELRLALNSWQLGSADLQENEE